jgi:hypothetical protein
MINLRIRHQEANVITLTTEILVTRTFEIRVEAVDEARDASMMDLEFVWNDVFFWDAGFGWHFFLMLYRRASGELGVRLVPL